MNNLFRKAISAIMVLFLVLGTLPLQSVSASEEQKFKDGEYNIPFDISKDNTNESSIMTTYIDKASGKLKVENGKPSFSFTLTKSKEITGFKTEINGVLTDAKVVSENTDINTRVVQFDVPDAKGRLNAWVKIDWEEVNYHHEYHIDVTFDTTSIPLAEDETTEPPVTEPPVTEPPVTEQQVIFKDGEYSIPFSILKDNTNESSIMTTYIDKASGKLKVENGKPSFSFTLTKSKEITGFKTEINGALTDAKVVSENTDINTRVVQFDVPDVKGRLNAWVKIDWEEVNYHHEYHIDLTFDTTSIPLAGDETTEPPVTVPTDPEAPLSTGKYALDYTVYKNGTSNVSSLEKNLTKPAVLQVSEADSAYTVNLILKDSSLIKVFQTEQNGQFEDASVLSVNEANDTRAVAFPVKDLTSKLNVYLEVEVPGAMQDGSTYVGKHNVQFQPGNTTSIKEVAITPETQSTLTYDGKLTVVVPSGANDVSFNLITRQLLAAEQSIMSAGVRLASPVYELTKTFEGNFKQPVTLKFNYDASQIPTGFKPAVHYYNEQTLSWELVDGGGSIVNGSIAANTNHFTKFAVLAIASNTSTSPETNTPGSGTTTPGSVITTPGTGVALADGTYTLDYNILKHGTTQASIMEQYVVKPAHLVVSGGKKNVQITLKQSAEITAFKVKRNGTLADAAVVSTDTAANTRTVQFEVDDLSKTSDAWVKIDWAAINYFHEYDVNITYGTPVLVSTPINSVTNPVADSLANGTYKLDYNILKSGHTEASVMEQYVVKPGQLIVINGKKHVRMTLKQSAEITAFKVKRNGALVDTTIVSTDKAANTRTVQFEVDDLSKKIDAWVKIDWAAVNYFHEYDVNLTFGTPVFVSASTPELTTTETGSEGTGNETSGTVLENPQVNFSDTSSHWAKDSIAEAVKQGFVTGYTDGTFRPNGEITRAEFTTMLSRALKLSGNPSLNFKDKASIPVWAQTYVAQAVEAGILNGYEDNTFRAKRNITRSELAVMVVGASGVTLEKNAKLSFADKASIPVWAQSSVAAAVSEGLIKGRGKNVFAPSANATRAEAVTLILNLLNYSR